MFLIGLLCNHFFENLYIQKFPSHVIIVRKEDILNIKHVVCKNFIGVNLTAKTIDLSKLEKLGKITFILYITRFSCYIIVLILS